MQSLYEWDFRGRKMEDLPVIVARNVKEFASGLEETDFIHQLIDGTIKHVKEIDKIIEKTKLSAAAVSSALAILEIKDKVRNLGANIFALSR